MELLCIYVFLCVLNSKVATILFFPSRNKRAWFRSPPHSTPTRGKIGSYVFDFHFFSIQNGQLAEWINRGCRSSAHIGFDSFCRLIYFLLFWQNADKIISGPFCQLVQWFESILFTISFWRLIGTHILRVQGPVELWFNLFSMKWQLIPSFYW